MGRQDTTIESPLASARGLDTRPACITQLPAEHSYRSAEPLFKRFGVAKDWRTKDSGVG